MKKYLPVIILTISLMANLKALAQAQPLVEVSAYAEHFGGNIVYRYIVKNNSQFEIGRVAIGRVEDKTGAEDPPELTVNPVGDGVERASFTHPGVAAPVNWDGYVSGSEMYPDKISIEWTLSDNSIHYFMPGQTWKNFSVTLPTYDNSYLTSHFSVIFSNVKKAADLHFTGSINAVDVVRPTLSVSLTPSVLWPANNKLVPVTATITVKDNYDPNPAVKLESITANEPLTAGDVADAAIGTDDRSFSLMAANPTLPRSYTVTYSATDGSGNKTLASATLWVDKSATPPKPAKPPKIPKGCNPADPSLRQPCP